MEFQTRNEIGETKHFRTLSDAIDEAFKDLTVWKISFSITETKERIRLVKNEEGIWQLRDIFGAV